MDSDSDFYGDEDEINELEARLSSFTPSTYWSNRQKLTMEAPSLFPSPASPPPNPNSSSSSSSKLHNPYEGRPNCAKQLSESPQAFLTRLPPSTTDLDPVHIPWIYVANPFIPRRQTTTSSSSSNEDEQEQEAPAEAGTQLGGFMEGGRERLALLGDFLRTVEAKTGSRGGGRGGGRGGMVSKAAVSREVARERNDAVNDVLMLARVLKVRTGKWMLFIPPAHVDTVWSAVVNATLKNELGIAAKVAPRPERGSTRDRLICVYTYDFGDGEDVARVLVRLRELGLLRGAGSGGGQQEQVIYYKADAYTYLGIASGNPWGLRASLYSSRDVLAGIRQRDGGRPAPAPIPPPTAPAAMRNQRTARKDEGEDVKMEDAWSF